MGDRKHSLMSDTRECLICKSTYNIVVHHIYEGYGRRSVSDREGAWCYLCAYHHNMSKWGVHFNKPLDLKLKKECQERWMEANNATVEDFIKVFSKSYI